MAAQKQNRGFTLVELLVVIAIIAILASLLLGSLSKAKATSLATRCASNLRQLTFAAHLYGADNNDFVPRTYWGSEGGKSEQLRSWVGGCMSHETTPGWHSENTNIILLFEPRYGHIGGYAPNHRIYRCPADRSWVVLAGKRHDRVRSYTVNYFTGKGYSKTPSIPAYRVVNRFSDSTHPSPASTFYFVDEHEDSIYDGNFVVRMLPEEETYWHNLPASRHAGAGALSFIDGHIEAKRWLDPRTRKPVERKFVYGYNSPNNPDLAWMQKRATAMVAY